MKFQMANWEPEETNWDPVFKISTLPALLMKVQCKKKKKKIHNLSFKVFNTLYFHYFVGHIVAKVLAFVKEK